MSLSDSRPLPCSESLAGDGERDGTWDANGERARTFIAEEEGSRREGAGRCTLASVVDCRAPGVMDTMG